MNEEITKVMEDIYKRYPNTLEATQALIDKLIADFEKEGTITGFTFSSIVREMASLSEPVRNACNLLYIHIIRICINKLVEDGMIEEKAHSVARMINASIEGGITPFFSENDCVPLRTVSEFIPILLQDCNKKG